MVVALTALLMTSCSKKSVYEEYMDLIEEATAKMGEIQTLEEFDEFKAAYAKKLSALNDRKDKEGYGIDDPAELNEAIDILVAALGDLKATTDYTENRLTYGDYLPGMADYELTAEEMAEIKADGARLVEKVNSANSVNDLNLAVSFAWELADSYNDKYPGISDSEFYQENVTRKYDEAVEKACGRLNISLEDYQDTGY